MQNDDDIKRLEDGILEKRKMVEVGNCIERLRNNRDFKEVILKGYFENEAIRLVHLKSDPSMQKPEKQADIVKQMDAIGSLSAYLNLQLTMAERAMAAIEADQLTIEELSAENLEGE